MTARKGKLRWMYRNAISDNKASPETAPSHTFKGAIHPSPQSLLCQTSPAETSTTTEEFNLFFTGLSLACATSKSPLLEGGNPVFTGVATPFPTAMITQINRGNGNMFGMNVHGQPLVAGSWWDLCQWVPWWRYVILFVRLHDQQLEWLSSTPGYPVIECVLRFIASQWGDNSFGDIFHTRCNFLLLFFICNLIRQKVFQKVFFYEPSMNC